jgi:hypothetical protein
MTKEKTLHINGCQLQYCCRFLGVQLKNTTMKYFLYFFILFLVISCRNGMQKNGPNIIVKASLIRSYDSLIYDRDTSRHAAFDVKISIINKSDEQVRFWIMSSSWFDNFLINNDYMYFICGDIEHNYPKIKHLNPNDSLVYKASIIKIGSTLYQTVPTTKFGFVFIDSLRNQRDEDFYNIIGDKSQHDKIFWSNPLYLNN